MPPTSRLTLLAAALCLPAVASQAACITVPAGVACTGTTATAVTETRSGVTITIGPGATLATATRPLVIDGAGVSVVNDGELRATSTANNNYAIVANGNNLAVTNNGIISSGDRALELLGATSGLSFYNAPGAEVLSRRQGLRAVELKGNVTVENDGLIQSTTGRALQLRGPDTTVINRGTMRGGEEVVEGREQFTLVNYGLIALNGLSWNPASRTWTNTGAPNDEDGVQFASGRLDNHGVILSTDDGIDIDEGVIHNHMTGVIIAAGPDTVRDSGAVDVDARFEPGSGTANFRPAGLLTIINEGYMEGPRGIVTELSSTAPITIINTGTIVGRSGIAIDLGPDQGDTLIELSGAGRIVGDILFGNGGTSTLKLGPFDDGAGIFSEVSARDGGSFDVVFGDGFTLEQILAYRFVADLFELDLQAGAGTFRLNAVNPASFTLAGQTYGGAAFADLLRTSGIAPIPVPAAAWLLVSGLGLLVSVRRRAGAATVATA
jgi:hypothetical protein